MEKFIKQGQIIVGLDFDNSQNALEITKFLNPENYKVKVGNQLFTACGPQILEDLKKQGFDIFLDLKYSKRFLTVCSAFSLMEHVFINIKLASSIFFEIE